jgi:hypothetical protein
MDKKLTKGMIIAAVASLITAGAFAQTKDAGPKKPKMVVDEAVQLQTEPAPAPAPKDKKKDKAPKISSDVVELDAKDPAAPTAPAAKKEKAAKAKKGDTTAPAPSDPAAPAAPAPTPKR